MLSLLLDENISHEIASQVFRKRPDIPIFSIHHWERGRLLSRGDEIILREAERAGLTLVTYDVTTIPPLLQRLAEEGFSHCGVIFIDRNAIPQRDFGRLIRALIAYWEAEKEAEWANRIVFLPAPRE